MKGGGLYLLTDTLMHTRTHSRTRSRLELSESPSERRKWTKDSEQDNALIKSHFNIPPAAKRRTTEEGRQRRGRDDEWKNER